MTFCVFVTTCPIASVNRTWSLIKKNALRTYTLYEHEHMCTFTYMRSIRRYTKIYVYTKRTCGVPYFRQYFAKSKKPSGPDSTW